MKVLIKENPAYGGEEPQPRGETKSQGETKSTSGQAAGSVQSTGTMMTGSSVSTVEVEPSGRLEKSSDATKGETKEK